MRKGYAIVRCVTAQIASELEFQLGLLSNAKMETMLLPVIHVRVCVCVCVCLFVCVFPAVCLCQIDFPFFYQTALTLPRRASCIVSRCLSS